MTGSLTSPIPLTTQAAQVEASAWLAFPLLDGIAPVTPLAQGWDHTVFESARAGVVWRVPRDEAAAQSQAREARLLPYLNAALSPALPVPEWLAPPDRTHPWGFQGHRKVPGAPLTPEAITERNAERLASNLAEVLFQIHRFAIDRAQALDVPGFRWWRRRYTEVREASVGALRSRLTVREAGRVRRWWTAFLADGPQWEIVPAFVHSDLTCAHLLLDLDGYRLGGVLDFGDAIIGDPAVDFAGLVGAYGTEFAWRVVEAYGKGGGTVDAALFQRVRRLGAAAPFFAVRQAARRGEEALMAQALAALRSGPVLG